MNPLLSLSAQDAQRFFIDMVPHSQALGLQLVSFEAGRMVLDLPYDRKLIGNTDNGVIHGGAITTLFDAACGGAILTKLYVPRRIATLDLRIDYLRPARPTHTVRCEAECYRVTHQVAFVRATAHDGDPEDLLATAAGSFVIFEDSSIRAWPFSTGEAA
jgi:uncharacterized protein (TIGR00369 family)